MALPRLPAPPSPGLGPTGTCTSTSCALPPSTLAAWLSSCLRPSLPLARSSFVKRAKEGVFSQKLSPHSLLRQAGEVEHSTAHRHGNTGTHTHTRTPTHTYTHMQGPGAPSCGIYMLAVQLCPVPYVLPKSPPQRVPLALLTPRGLEGRECNGDM